MAATSPPSPTSTNSCGPPPAASSSASWPPRRALGGGALVPRRGLSEAGGPGPAGPEVPGGARRAGGRLPARGGAVRGDGADRLRRGGRGDRRPHQHRHPADLEVRHRGPAAALPRPGDPRRADRRARHHRAGRRLRRGGAQRPARSGSTAASSSTARRPTSPTASAPHFIVTAVRTTPRGWPPRHLLPDRRPRRGGQLARSSRSSAGTPPTPRRSPSRTCSCRRRTCSASSTRASS